MCDIIYQNLWIHLISNTSCQKREITITTHTIIKQERQQSHRYLILYRATRSLCEHNVLFKYKIHLKRKEFLNQLLAKNLYTTKIWCSVWIMIFKALQFFNMCSKYHHHPETSGSYLGNQDIWPIIRPHHCGFLKEYQCLAASTKTE